MEMRADCRWYGKGLLISKINSFHADSIMEKAGRNSAYIFDFDARVWLYSTKTNRYDVNVVMLMLRC